MGRMRTTGAVLGALVLAATAGACSGTTDEGAGSTSGGTNPAGDGTTSVGTASPAGTAIAGSTTARAEPPAPDAIRAVDFADLTFPSDSCGDMFHEAPREGYAMDGGQVQGGDDPADEDFYAVYLRPEISYGDLDGDGVEEALVILDCTPGNRPYGFAAIWTPEADGATRLVRIASNIGTDPGRGDHRLQEATLRTGAIDVVWQVFGEGDPACCPSEEARVTLRWQDGALVPESPATYGEAEQPG